MPTGDLPPAGHPASKRRPRFPTRLLAWAAAGLIFTLILRRLPFEALGEAMRGGPHGILFLYCLAATSAMTLADCWSTFVLLRLIGIGRPFRQILLVRGALNVVGLIHQSAVQVLFGAYLYRTGASMRQSAGAVALIIGTQLGGLATLGAIGVAFPEHLPPLALRMAWLYLLATLAGALAIFALPALNRRLRRWRDTRGFGTAFGRLFEHFFEPVADFRPSVVVSAAVARWPHILTLALGSWGGLYVWGVKVPALDALLLMPTALITAALPITPGGLGSLQAVMIWLFAPFAHGDPETAEAAVFSASLFWTSYGLIAQLLVGLLCLAVLKAKDPKILDLKTLDSTTKGPSQRTGGET